MKYLIPGLLFLFIFSSCVSSKKYKLAQSDNENLKTLLNNCKADLSDCMSSKESVIIQNKTKMGEMESGMNTRNEKIKTLEDQIDFLKRNNNNLLDRLSDLSIVSKTGAESIKKSLEAMNEKDKYIKELNSAVKSKDSLNLSLIMNLKKSLGDIPTEDVNIEVKKGVVYISLSDKLLFKSASAVINEQAASTLEKIAKIVNDQKNIDILIESHTDNVPINTDCLLDNWDLSSKRSTAIARLLQRKYNVDPSRITAGGRSEYMPKMANDSEKGRSINRRTEIIILPKLDQFFDLIAPEVK
ncbi:MAG: flagellar motor protein MotB [Saprospiraceae bacterium]